jgi:hypothetical protein
MRFVRLTTAFGMRSGWVLTLPRWMNRLLDRRSFSARDEHAQS